MKRPVYLSPLVGMLLASGALVQATSATAQPAPPVEPAAPAEPAAPPAEAPPDGARPPPAADPDETPPAAVPPGEPAAAEPATLPAAPAAVPAEPEAPVETGTEAEASDAADLMAEAEAAEIEQALLAGGEAETDEYKLDLYGFADFTYSYQVREFALGIPYDSFAVGRLNLYAASELGDNWRSLAEVRFTYLPHGSTTYDEVGTPTRQDTTATDYTDLNRPIRVGGTVIERAWIEYSAHPLANIRLGHWLTPYGIWNVDHGSPVIVGVRRPFVVGEALLPQSQTGIQLHGSYHLAPVQLGYNLTLSNGRGPIDTHQDLNDNKAIGGRLFSRIDLDSAALTLGVSAYRGKFTDRGEAFTIDADGNFVTVRPRTMEYQEFSFAQDIKLEWGGFLLQGESIFNDVVFDDLRPVDVFAPPTNPGFLADYRRVGVYGLTGYRFDMGLMPFAGIEYYDNGSPFLNKSAAFWGGLNYRPTPRVVLKTQYTYSWFPDQDDLPEGYHYNAIDTQVAWSF